MKIRTDFVTNSSSSSFIIAYKKLPEIDEDTINKYPFLKNCSDIIYKILFTSDDYGETEEAIKYESQEEIDKYFLDRWYGDTIDEIFEDEPWLKDTYDKAIGFMKQGYTVFSKEVDNNNRYFNNLIKELEGDDFVIIVED